MTNYSRMNNAETDVLPVIKGNGNNFQLNPKQYLIDQKDQRVTTHCYTLDRRNEMKKMY